MVDARQYKPEEDETIKIEWEKGTRVIDIAAMLGRSPGSIKNRSRRLGMEKRKIGKNMQTNKAVGEPYKRPQERFIAYGIPKPLMDLGTYDCHFQIEDKIEFCGARATRAYGYCPDHNACCYRE